MLDNINLDIYKGEFVTLLGSSGCGKTTLLRIIAGFEAVASGEVWLNGANITALPPERRHVNTVFQSYALFPHMNVYDNIAYGPKIRKIPKDRIKSAVEDMLRLVKLEGFEKRMPTALSGGERQRVAIARALINRPEMLLLDEPLGALDLKLRKHMQTELKQLQKATGVTFIYVTHDQEEALFLSDKIAVMNNKGVCRYGTPEEIYNNPVDFFTASFVGERNIFEVQVLESNETGSLVEFNGSVFRASGVPKSKRTRAAVMYDAVNVSTDKAGGGITATVLGQSYVGAQTRLDLDCGGTMIRAVAYNKKYPVSAGETAYINFGPEDVLLPEGGELP